MVRAGRQLEAELAAAAAGQWGLFTAAQALRLKLTRDRISQLVSLDRITHTDVRGVYRFAGAPVDVTLDALRATWLSFHPGAFAGERLRALHTDGGDAIVSHVSAANYVYQLGTLQPDRLDFTMPVRRRTTHPLLCIHIAEQVDWCVVAGLPVTSVPQTVADIYRQGIDTGHFGDILADILATAAADIRALASALDPLTRGKGRDVVLHALSAAGAPESLAAGNEILFAGRR